MNLLICNDNNMLYQNVNLLICNDNMSYQMLPFQLSVVASLKSIDYQVNKIVWSSNTEWRHICNCIQGCESLESGCYSCQGKCIAVKEMLVSYSTFLF